MRLDLGESGFLVLQRADRPGTVDHLAIKVDGFDRNQVTQELKASGINPVGEPNVLGTPGFHVVDPDGFKVQLV